MTPELTVDINHLFEYRATRLAMASIHLCQQTNISITVATLNPFAAYQKN
ncbi:MAG: hypothetical protein ACJAVI_004174 [Candidatus Azotimanducaceae bacterium]